MSAFTVRQGSVVIKGFASPVRVGLRIYPRWEIRWTDHHGQRRRMKRSKFAAARAEAVRIAREINQGLARSDLTTQDVERFIQAENNLYGAPIGIVEASALVARLISICPASQIEEALAWAMIHRKQPSFNLTVAEAVDRLIAEKRSLSASKRYLDTLRSHLKRFKHAFSGRMADISPEAVSSWAFGDVKLSRRTCNNLLASVQTLFASSALVEMPQARAIVRLSPAALPEQLIQLWTATELHALLTRAGDGPLMPVLALGGFAGMRTSEILACDWINIRIPDNQIVLHGGQTKTRRRRLVEPSANCMAWLAQAADREGPIWKRSESKLRVALRKLASACGLKWRRNALRKSFLTYSKLAGTDSRDLALSAGHSQTTMERYYLQFHGVTKADSKAWFAIQPKAEEDAGILRLPI